MGTRRLFYARALLVAGHFQRSPAYEMALVAVMTAEDSLAGWNPLDTTLERPGATPYNSFGPGGTEHVWNYPDAVVGVQATLETMAQPNMDPWTTALRTRGHSAVELCHAFSLTPWGGVGDVLPIEIVRDWQRRLRSYVADRRALVEGAGPWPYRHDGKAKR